MENIFYTESGIMLAIIIDILKNALKWVNISTKAIKATRREMDNLNFPFNMEKAAQAIKILLELEDNNMNYMRLLKLLYIADRESLRETGYPITGDRVCAMDQGPVLSNTYNLIKSDPGCSDEKSEYWDKYFERRHYRIILKDDPGIGKLCKYEIDKLKEISAKFIEYDEWALVDYTHDFEEYKKNKPPKGSSKGIALSHIIEAIGQNDKLKQIRQNAKEARFFNSIANDDIQC